MSLFGFGKKESGDADPTTLSKRDYERTTQDSPASTSLIPAIKRSGDDDGEPTQGIPRLADVPERSPNAATAPALMGRSRTTQRLTRIDPYSVTRLAFVVSVALMIVASVAAALFWIVLSVTGVWDEINGAVASLLSDDSTSFDITDYLGFTRVVGGTLVISGINVILMTMLATVGAHLYNLAASLLGGVAATFTQD